VFTQNTLYQSANRVFPHVQSGMDSFERLSGKAGLLSIIAGIARHRGFADGNGNGSLCLPALQKRKDAGYKFMDEETY
jgi:hypothetical protein